MKIGSIDLGTRNLAWCVLNDYGTGHEKIQEWKLIDLGAEDFNKTDIATCVELLLKKLEDFPEVDHVFLEQQPVSRVGVSNIKTKVLSHICQAHFVLRNTPVQFVSALRNKELKTDEGKDLSYAQRKKAAVEKTKALLKDDKKWLDYLLTFKKKDDLADCYLQAFTPIKKKSKKRKRTEIEPPFPDL